MSKERKPRLDSQFTNVIFSFVRRIGMISHEYVGAATGEKPEQVAYEDIVRIMRRMRDVCDCHSPTWSEPVEDKESIEPIVSLLGIPAALSEVVQSIEQDEGAKRVAIGRLVASSFRLAEDLGFNPEECVEEYIEHVQNMDIPEEAKEAENGSEQE